MAKKRPLTLSVYELEKFSKRQGGTVVCESSGRMHVYQCESPAGKVWSASQTHCLRVEWRDKNSQEREDAVKDAIRCMSYGVEECTNLDCDYCEDRGTSI